MKAIETPVRKCFSSDDMEGSYYHEYNESNKIKHTTHRYDKYGRYVQHSTNDISKLSCKSDFYVSDRFGNKL